jgi:hypothetical protein
MLNSRMGKLCRLAVAALIGLASMSFGQAAEAQSLRVVPVPWVATDTTIPHHAYNGHATTFKAIARGGNGTYLYEWDFQGDGVYDFSATTNNRYNLSTRFTYPNQAATTTFVAKIRVTSNGQTVTGDYPVRVFADVPANPANANSRQLQVMRSVAVDDGLWFLHNQLTRSGDESHPTTGAQITGNLGGTAHTSGFLWALALNGHYAAFPDAYIGTLPNPADNTARWRDDPYAEDAARLVNYVLTNFTVVSVGTNPTNTQASPNDESNLTGFYPEVSAPPIFGTDDGIGLLVAGDMYNNGHALSALSVARLGGYVAQVGDQNRILGRRFEFVLQQFVDGVVFAQNDAGSYPGSWYYTANANAEDLSTTLWGLTGLWHADTFARDQGIIVPNIAKVRMVSYVFQGSRSCANGGTGGSYQTSTCDFTLTAAHLLALGWVGGNTFATTDSRLAFPGYSLNVNPTLGQLRSQYNSTMVFITNTFNLSVAGMSNWNTDFVGSGGNFDRVDGMGNHYAMLHWQDAARASTPAIVNFGNNDWLRQFSRYFINNQAANGGWNWVHNGTSHSDNTGGPALRAAWAMLVLSPDAIPPLAIGQSSVASAPEGTAIDFNGTSSDPGTGNPIYTWAFGNGATLPGQNVSYAYPDNGMFNATLTSTSTGGTSVDTIPVTITNVAPVVNAGDDATVNEGDSLPFAMTFTDPGTGDTHTFSWTFGDTTTSNAQNVNKTYADNGVFNVGGRVTDDDGGTNQDIRVVTVNNVAPTITSTPGNAATEASQYTYTLTFTDPGTADTHQCTAPVRPAGSSIVGCQLVWTPDFSQAIGSAVPVRMCVTDDDGGQTCQDYTIAVTFLDSDADGLPDSWEVSNFGNITSQDGTGDPDGDGSTNLDEFQDVTDPLTFDGPNNPVPLSPACGSSITSQQPTLVVTNATDPQGAALQYHFELYADASLTILLAMQDNIPQGAGATTAWNAPVTLQENGHYYWRARAKDAYTYGAFTTPACDFIVNTVNDAPGAPHINMPTIGGQANALRPDLIVDNASDPDGDTLTYTFEVYSNAGLTNLVVSEAGVTAGTSGTTTWTVTTDLAEDTQYYWRARATDGAPLSGPWSVTGSFLVTTMNATPTAPVLVSPQNGTNMSSLRPNLVILDGTDSDHDPLVYDWQLATDNAFGTILAEGTDVAPAGGGNTTFALAADLSEDTQYCWRARSDDGLTTSTYSTACFFVSMQNDPPSVPTLNNPSANSMVLTQSPIYSWAPSTDPESNTISYEIEVRDTSGTVIATSTVLGGTVTSMSGTLENGETYMWRARAVDSGGAASEFSADNVFEVDAPIDTPDVVVNGSGCCQTGSNPSGGTLLAGLVMGMLLRRRRRSAK